MIPPVLAILTIVFFFGMIAAACVFVAIAFRGRAVPCPPCCAGCRHAIGDLVVAAGRRCPECGRALDGEDDIRYFRVALKARPFVYAGLLLALGFGAAFGVALLRSLSARNVALNQTTASLVAAVRANGTNAFQELASLARAAPTMTDADLSSVVDALKAAKDAGTLLYVNTDAADLLAEAQRRTLVTDETLVDIAAVGRRAMRLDVPDDVRVGTEYQLERRVTDNAVGATVTTTVTGVTIDGTPIPLPGDEGAWTEVRFDVPPGPHTITATFAAVVSLTGTSGALPPTRATITTSQPVRVHAADAPTWITLVDDPALAAEVRAAIRASVVALDRQPDGKTAIRADVELRPAPSVPLSFACSVEIDGVRHPLGARWSMMTSNGSSYTSGTVAGAADVPATASATATLILTPAPDAIETQRGVERIWGGEIRIPLTVVRDGQRTPPRPPPPPLPQPTDRAATSPAGGAR
jgi:hypothetical protein